MKMKTILKITLLAFIALNLNGCFNSDDKKAKDIMTKRIIADEKALKEMNKNMNKRQKNNMADFFKDIKNNKKPKPKK